MGRTTSHFEAGCTSEFKISISVNRVKYVHTLAYIGHFFPSAPAFCPISLEATPPTTALE